MTSHLPWFVARASGMVSWTLLTASVLWGLALSTKFSAFGRRPRPAWTLDLHRWLGALATVFTVVHIGAVLADSYTQFDLASVLIPFASKWRPTAIAWGVVSLYLLLAVELTSLARSHMPRRWWRAVHLASFPLFLLATLHGFTAGTDAKTWVYVVFSAAAAIPVAALVGQRLEGTPRNSRGWAEAPAGR
ncbi:MAG: ferric reductase-like transmembrane domain-containing protein [Actinobacteria bacterium]|nr:ferric reductase-like transmembrane domain-containing protein [Actinomycetota bacterium]